MAGQPYGTGTKVTVRKYIAEKEPDVADKVGEVIEVPDGQEAPRGRAIPVQWEGVEGVRFYAASNLKPARDGTEPVQADQGARRASSSGSTGSNTQTGDPAVDRALDPNAPAIADGDVRQLRSYRSRMIHHLLNPTDPEFGGGADHDHGQLERAESTIKGGSVEDLNAWHRNAHKRIQPDQPHDVIPVAAG